MKTPVRPLFSEPLLLVGCFEGRLRRQLDAFLDRRHALAVAQLARFCPSRCAVTIATIAMPTPNTIPRIGIISAM